MLFLCIFLFTIQVLGASKNDDLVATLFRLCNYDEIEGLSFQEIQHCQVSIKFIYSEKATKFCEIFTLLLSYVVPVKSKVKISQNCVAFSEYMNFTLFILNSETSNLETSKPI